MKKLSILFAALAVVALPSIAGAQYYDGFDTYAAGSGIVGQGGWQAWGGVPGVDATVTSAVSNTAPNSLNLSPTADVTQSFSGILAGTWYAKAQVYIPTGHSGDTYFIMLNKFDGVCANAGDCNWSLQIRFSATDGVAESLGGSDNGSASTLPIILDQFVEVVAEINLDTNTYTVYYDGTPLDSLPWNVSGNNEIAAFDLYCDGCSESYMDDIYLADTVPVTLQSVSAE